MRAALACHVLFSMLAASCAATQATPDAQPTGEVCPLDASYLIRACNCPPGCGGCAQVCMPPGVWGPCEPGAGMCDGGSRLDLGSADAGPPSADTAPPIDFGFACGHVCERCCPGDLCLDGSACNGISCWLGPPCGDF